MMKLATDLNTKWDAYVKIVGDEKAKKLNYMDTATFTTFFDEAEKAHDAALKA